MLFVPGRKRIKELHDEVGERGRQSENPKTNKQHCQKILQNGNKRLRKKFGLTRCSAQNTVVLQINRKHSILLCDDLQLKPIVICDHEQVVTSCIC